MKLLCDEMLMRLGRWLRAAGHDTAIAGQGTPDRDIIAMARREGRLLITRDRKMMEHRHAAACVCILAGNTLQECVRELTQRLAINWMHAPFSRCLLCNTPLVKADEEMFSRIPFHSCRAIDEAYFCPDCGKPYWHGGHVRRMRARLAAWNAGGSAPSPDAGKHRPGDVVPEAEQGTGQGCQR